MPLIRNLKNNNTECENCLKEGCAECSDKNCSCKVCEPYYYKRHLNGIVSCLKPLDECKIPADWYYCVRCKHGYKLKRIPDSYNICDSVETCKRSEEFFGCISCADGLFLLKNKDEAFRQCVNYKKFNCYNYADLKGCTSCPYSNSLKYDEELDVYRCEPGSSDEGDSISYFYLLWYLLLFILIMILLSVLTVFCKKRFRRKPVVFYPVSILLTKIY
jgi:hypothetical protein